MIIVLVYASENFHGGSVDVAVGTVMKRASVHDEYGGNRQSGIASCPAASTVLLFTNPSRGHQHGYFDGWGNDGCFYYAGEGQTGDQRMISGNKAVLNHAQNRCKLQLWKSVSKGVVAYVGEFMLDEKQPYIITDAHDTNGENRSVIMFRLRPATGTPVEGPILPVTPAFTDVVANIPLEQQLTDSMLINPSIEPRTAERREAKLVTEYGLYLTGLGHEVTRNKIIPAGESKPLYTDLFDVTDNVLVEAKGAATRVAVRMAVGQLFDYHRFIPCSPSLAILLPTRPRTDLLALCASVAISVIWQDGKHFVSRAS